MADTVKVVARLRRVSDGLVREYTEDVPSEYADGQDYMWCDGNFSCDCNRALLFARSATEDEPDVPCGEKAFVLESLTVNGEQARIDPL